MAAISFLLLTAGASAQSRQPPEQPRADNHQAAANQQEPRGEAIAVEQVGPDSSDDGASEQERERERQAVNEGRMVLLTALLAFFALAQVIVTGITLRGLKYARRSADAAEANIQTIQNTSKAQLRPYVYVISGMLTDVKSPGPVRVVITIKNGGATPAYDLTHQTGTRFRMADFKDFELPADIPLSKGTLGPDAAVESALEVKREQWNERVGGLMDGSIVLTVLGEIRYRDAFGETHFTKYRYHVLPGVIRDGTLAVSQDGNEST